MSEVQGAYRLDVESRAIKKPCEQVEAVVNAVNVPVPLLDHIEKLLPTKQEMYNLLVDRSIVNALRTLQEPERVVGEALGEVHFWIVLEPVHAA